MLNLLIDETQAIAICITNEDQATQNDISQWVDDIVENLETIRAQLTKTAPDDTKPGVSNGGVIKRISEAKRSDPSYRKGCTAQKQREWYREYVGLIYAGFEALQSAQEPQPRLDPDMPAQELRLHMGELTEDEMLVARAAIRWANSSRFVSIAGENDTKSKVCIEAYKCDGCGHLSKTKKPDIPSTCISCCPERKPYPLYRQASPTIPEGYALQKEQNDE